MTEKEFMESLHRQGMTTDDIPKWVEVAAKTAVIILLLSCIYGMCLGTESCANYVPITF